jgi:hypothetical protein
VQVAQEQPFNKPNKALEAINWPTASSVIDAAQFQPQATALGQRVRQIVGLQRVESSRTVARRERLQPRHCRHSSNMTASDSTLSGQAIQQHPPGPGAHYGDAALDDIRLCLIALDPRATLWQIKRI